MIANTSDQEATVRAYVIAGGITYTFPNTPVSPGATALFDVDAIRAAQTSDASGKKIPKSALYGKFHWTTLPGKDSQQGLHGRTELKSLQALRASSFSCGGDCPYQEWSYPYFDTDPFAPYADPYLQDARETTLHDYFRDTYGNVSYNSMTTGSMYPDSIDDTSILSMTSINNDLTLRMDTGNPGSTYLHYYFTDNYTYISSTDDGNPDACTVQPSGSASGGSTEVALCSTPDGETTQYIRQTVTSDAAPTASDFLQTLSTSGNNDGNFIMEANNANGTDSCYFNGSAIAPFTTVTGSQWSVGGVTGNFPESQVVTPGHNQWGPDVVGYLPGSVRYYQQNRPRLGLSLPCGSNLQQNLEVKCTQASQGTTYKIANPLASTIDSTGISNCRSGACSPHYDYQ